MPDSFQRPTAEDLHTTEVQGLFIKYQPVVRGYVLSMTPDFAMADDVMQETFLVVSRKAASFVIGTSFPAWVKTIARFKTLEAIRASGRQHEHLSEAVIDAISAESLDFPADVDRRLGLLAECIEQLAPQAKRSILFRYRNDHRPPEIASRMGCTIQSVNVTLSRARAFLRECVMGKMPGTST